MKKIIITGINGQDGAYLAKLLLKNNRNKVIGILRRTANYKLDRLNYLGITKKINIIYCDVCEHENMNNIIKKIRPDYIYNLAAQSFVDYSFKNPHSTFQINTQAVFNILETIKKLKLDTKFYQASSSEMYGNSNVNKQDEKTNFLPVSPYAVSKVLSYNLTKTYRETFGIFASNGILFNHESPYRGTEFVTKKIVSALTRIKYGSNEILKLGNLDSYRDWGFAEDYVSAMVKIMSSKTPDDFVVATGKSCSVRNFFLKVCDQLSLKVKKNKTRSKEFYINKQNNKIIMQTDRSFLRKDELHYLCGDYKKINKSLGWKPKVSLDQLIKIMLEFERNKILKKEDYKFNNY
jgi:GDPmannose 4,6-dehydratase